MKNIIVFTQGFIFRGYSVPDDWSKYLIDEFVDSLQEEGMIELHLSWKYAPEFQKVEKFKIFDTESKAEFTPLIRRST